MAPVEDGSNSASATEHESIDKSKLVPIPQPPEHLFGLLGNLPDVDPSFPTRSTWHLMELYGPIFKLNLAQEQVFIGTQELVNEVCDEARFVKVPSRALVELRALLGDGLFTSYIEEENWWIAHRLLVPAFGPLGIRKMFDEMLDISSQMVLRWDRQGPEHEIDCADDLTRLAFDTIGLCAFNFRFNEFYSDHPHPFASQMADVLIESGKKATRAKLQQNLYWRSEETRQENVRKMWELCDQIVQDRRDHPQPDNKDLLNTMLNGVDKETGKKLSTENIRYQMATFLVAGHETTSATLSFNYLNLLKNPEKLHKATKQVDEVLGDKVLTVDMLPKLTYLDACIKETLRMSSPISVFNVTSQKDQVIGGKYFLPKGQAVTVSLRNLHHDRAAWGDDVDEFKPERFLDGKFQQLPPNTWKPFGNGMRACIGRGFAEQEMLMNTALVLQRFQLELADPDYDLKLKSTLTIKPLGFKMKVRRRPGKSLMLGIPGGIPSETAEKHKDQHDAAHKPKAGADGQAKPVSVFFGGETGTCESLAQELTEKGSDFRLEFNVQSLDYATENLSTDQPNILITSSYEGHPPANAKKFVSWLEHLDGSSGKLSKAKYAVFGVGNSDWASTFHRIPKLCNESIEKLGGERIIDAGFSDVKSDLVGPWEEWSANLMSALSDGKEATASVGVDVSIESSKVQQTLGGEEMTTGTVISNKELADTSAGPAKLHMEVRLPEGTSYNAGDYLVIQARNPEEAVRRVLVRFGLSEHDMMKVNGSKKKFLPTEPILVEEFLLHSVELATPVTKRQLSILASHAKEGSDERKQLEAIQEDKEYQEILQERFSILDVLEDLPSLEVPFGTYVGMLQALTPRQYSISSSPLHPDNNPGRKESADIASITYDVHESPATSGHGTFHGVASSYLASRRAGDKIACFVRSTNVGFRLPSDTETPIIMISAGTGIAPMRAFIQERAAIREAGVKKLGPAMLFFGCRNESKDFIYKDELDKWVEQGVVEVKPAFSRPDNGKKQYAYEVLKDESDRVAELFKAGGKIYLCGSASRLGKSTAEACKDIYMEKTGKTQEEADQWLESVKSDRYVSDVY